MPSSRRPTEIAGPHIRACRQHAPNVRRLCLDALAEFARSRVPADAILDHVGGVLPASSADRAFLTELFYGVLRNLSLLDAWARHLRGGGTDPATRDILRLGLYQLLVAGVPAHASVNETVALAGRSRKLVNAILRRAIREREHLVRFAEALPPYVRFSHPKFLYARWASRFGEADAARLMEINNRPPPICGRVNTLKVQSRSFFSDLGSVAEQLTDTPGGVGVKFRKLPRAQLEAGLVYIQDPSTLHAPHLLDPLPGELVLDACAAPGGKTSHLAALMGGTGRVIAVDVVPARLARLVENLERLGATNVEVVRQDWLADPIPEGWRGRFDKILLDAPCSNSGVLRRRVDARWLIKESDFQRMPAVQLKILEAVAPLLKRGGALVYSTCSIEQEEGDDVVEAFLASHAGWKLDPAHPPRMLLPHVDGWDGAFVARMIRA